MNGPFKGVIQHSNFSDKKIEVQNIKGDFKESTSAQSCESHQLPSFRYDVELFITSEKEPMKAICK